MGTDDVEVGMIELLHNILLGEVALGRMTNVDELIQVSLPSDVMPIGKYITPHLIFSNEVSKLIRDGNVICVL